MTTLGIDVEFFCLSCFKNFWRIFKATKMIKRNKRSFMNIKGESSVPCPYIEGPSCRMSRASLLPLPSKNLTFFNLFFNFFAYSANSIRITVKFAKKGLSLSILLRTTWNFKQTLLKNIYRSTKLKIKLKIEKKIQDCTPP